MRIQTFSIVAGSEACNARCPYCVSKMTPEHADEDLDGAGREPRINWRNFAVACRFAKDSGVSTVLLTGKGEPTLFPRQLTRYLECLEPFGFPFVELQTNGIALAERAEAPGWLAGWYHRGLTVVALSIVHHDPERNRDVMRPSRPAVDLAALIGRLHEAGLSVRLSCTMLGRMVDGPEAMEDLVAYARRQGVEQLTLRPVQMPERSRDGDVAGWVEQHRLPADAIERLRERLDRGGTRLLELVHGAVVYDYDGQNVCLTNCLTLDPSDERIRQLIFFADGHLRYDWQYPGAILL